MGHRIQGLEMSLQRQQLPQNPTSQLAVYPHHHREYEQQHPGLSLTQFPAMQDCTFSAKPKFQIFTLSDDDEPGHTTTTENSTDDGKRTTSSSPWHRMKWTDNMVKLLIMVVFYIGDEVCSEANNEASTGKKKGSSSLVLQKKGKWKSVSTAMMEKGFNVSPQQCEDKFNDLNKRYKRVNDILGKGTACKVVGDQSLLETMDHLTPKMKEEVKKLLNSKHLYFKEMCTYHNSCGHGTGGSQKSPDGATKQSKSVQQQQQRPQHLSARVANSQQEDEYDEEEDDEEDIDYDKDDDDIDDNLSNTKRQRKDVDGGRHVVLSPRVEKVSSELKKVVEDERNNRTEKMEWMKGRLLHLEEEQMGYASEALKMEKERLKWVKYRNKKEREMDREKAMNEEKKLENERMMLLIQQKELHLILHQSSSSSS